MRFWNGLVLTLVAVNVLSVSTGLGSIAARVQAAATQATQTVPEQASQLPLQAPKKAAGPAMTTSKGGHDVVLGDGEPMELEGPHFDVPQPGAKERSQHPTATPPNRGQATRINVADWFNVAAEPESRSESSESAVSLPHTESTRPPAAGQPVTERHASSRRRAALRDLPTPESIIADPPPQGPLALSGPTAQDDEGDDESPLAELSSELNLPEEPAILSAAGGKPIESHAAQGTVPEIARRGDTGSSAAKPRTDQSTTTPSQVSEVESDAQRKPGGSEDDRPLVAPSTPPQQFSPQMLRLRDRIRVCLTHYFQHAESVNERSPWGVMHSLISYGVDTEVLAGKQRVNAIAWLCYNRPCHGMQLLQLEDGRVAPRNGPGYQGHEGQFLSMLALSRVQSTYPIRVDGKDFTVQDLIEYEKWTCRPKSELTFKLIGLAHYLPSDATWTSKWGEEWSIPRLIQEELAQPINGACCGGTHRLIGYSMAVQVRQKRGEPLDGQWLRAAKYLDGYHKYVMKLQNRDGSFSTSWLQKRDDSGDVNRRIQTSGHILEWLIFSLPVEDLTDRRIVAAVTYLNNAMLSDRTGEWEIGPRGHALRALALYNERVFGDKPGQRRAMLARRPRK